jgi:outer membrane immunogenic protein
MKKILLSSVALLGLTAGAMAADLPSRRAPAPMIAAVPVFTWTGFYVGVNAGYGWNNNDVSVTIPTVGTFTSDDEGGFVGGAQVGYNYQMGSLVLGIEADLQYADLGGEVVIPGFVGFDDGDNYFGTVRARVGVAFDRALVYATGGFAYGDVGGGFGSDANGGWTLGGGLEYAFTNNLTAKVEGLYVNLERDNNNFVVGLPAGTLISNDNSEFAVVRAGLNFKFGTY